MSEPNTPWPHAPTHQLATSGTFFVTASTYKKAHHFRGANRLRVLHRGLLTVARDFGWQLEAWAVFSNHYHFVAHSPSNQPTAESLGSMLKTLHVKTSGWVNRLDKAPARQVWFNFRETRLTYPRSYFGTTELHTPKPGETRVGAGGEPISLVLGCLVRKNCLSRAGENHLPVQDG